MRERVKRARYSVPGWSGKTLDKVDSRSAALRGSFAGANEEEKTAPLRSE
jgi:hypothetical protein